MRYQTLDLPPSKAAGFMPIPAATNTAAGWGLVHILGAPGTLEVEAPSPDGSLPTISARAGRDSARPSDVSPDVAFPSIYVALATNMGPAADAGIGMWRRRFNELPVPALNPTRVATSDSLVTTKGSRVSQAWPRAFQRFPTGP